MVSKKALTRNLKEFAVEQLGIDLIGVAPVERLARGPEGGRPTDYLPDARYVIAAAAKIPDAAVEVAGHYGEPGKTLGPYMWYGYVVLNWDLSSAANRLVRFLSEGALPAYPSHLPGYYTSMVTGPTSRIDMPPSPPASASSASAVFC